MQLSHTATILRIIHCRNRESGADSCRRNTQEMKRSLALFAFLSAGAFASADTIFGFVTLSNIPSVDAFRDPDNFVANVDWGTAFSGQYMNFRVTGIGYNVNLRADSPSWLSEMALAMERTDLSAGVVLRPGVGVNNPGTQNFNSGGIIDLVGLGLDFTLLANDTMRFEFFETFVDFPNAADGVWLDGRVDFRFEADLVPEPATMTALGLGLAALAARRRRK